MKTFNIYISGVGGQGIGLLSEILLRALDHAGKNAIGVDTHGLAQRGGMVASQIRFGEKIYSPIISRHNADIVVSLERHEALRAANSYLKPEGTLIYYDACWQPLSVRLGKDKELSCKEIEEYCNKNSFKHKRIVTADLPDARMQNISLLAGICREKLIAGVEKEHYESAMKDLLAGEMLDINLGLFRELS